MKVRVSTRVLREIEAWASMERMIQKMYPEKPKEEEKPVRGSRKCGTCAYSSLEQVKVTKPKKGQPDHEYQLFCRFMPCVARVERDGWCYQWELKHD